MPRLACFATWQSSHKTQPSTYISSCVGILADPAGNKSDMRAETSCPVFLCFAGNSTGSCSALCVAPVFQDRSEVRTPSNNIESFDPIFGFRKNWFSKFRINL